MLCSAAMGWLRLVGSLKLYVSFAKYSLFYRALLQKRPIIFKSLVIVATPYWIKWPMPYTHTHAYTYTHTHVHTHVYTYTRTHVHAHMHIHTHSHTYTRTCIYIYTHMCICVCIVQCCYLMKRPVPMCAKCGYLCICVYTYRVAKTHRMPHLYRSFSAEEPYN